MPRKPDNGVEKLNPARFIRLEPEIDQLIEDIAREDDRPIGRVIRRLIRAGLEAQGYIAKVPSKLKRLG